MKMPKVGLIREYCPLPAARRSRQRGKRSDTVTIAQHSTPRRRMPTTSEGQRSVKGLLALPESSLPVPAASERMTWAADRVHLETLRELCERAEPERGTPWPVPLAHGYARYFR